MKKTWSFEFLTKYSNKRLFTAHWGTDNLEWMKNIRENDYVVFSDVSMPGPASTVADVLSKVNYPNNFLFLSNDIMVHTDRLKSGIKSYFINQNAFIDEKVFNIDMQANKEFDVIYNARLRPVKRHFLAKKLGDELKLALIVGHHTPGLSSVPDEEVPNNYYLNTFQLQPSSVVKLLNKSKVGIILSESEGACFSSSEYLLCGLPVVSTFTRGGREFWYDETNSIICKPDEQSILDAVKKLISQNIDPLLIRENHIKKMFMHRQKFIDLVLVGFFGYDRPVENIESLFDSFNFRRYLAFQQKYSWKSMDSIVDFLKYEIEPEEIEIFKIGFDLQ